MRFTILMCTHNGAAHLPAQLASFVAQVGVDWDLWVSDDHSTDATWEILEDFAARQAPHRTVRLLQGPGQGGTRNYLTLLCHPNLPAGPVALSDQDDVWYPEKLSRAAKALDCGETVSVYGAQSRHTDSDLRPIGTSRPPRRDPSFGNALVQNIVSGHSACLSPAALALVRRAGVPATAIPYHDWWLYLLISGAGGRVIIDDATVLDYRQHGRNAMGAHRGPLASLRRIGQLFGRDYRRWLTANMDALAAVSDLLSPEHKARLHTVQGAVRRPGPTRMRAFRQAGLYRQTPLTNAALYLAAGLGRI